MTPADPAPPSPPSVPWPFRGRGPELAILAEALAAPGFVCLGIDGRAGVGRAALLAEALRRAGRPAPVVVAQGDGDEAGVRFAFAAALAADLALPERALRAGLRTPADLALRLVEVLARGHMVVLDGAEALARKALHPVLAALDAAVPDLVAAGAGGLVLMAAPAGALAPLLARPAARQLARQCRPLTLGPWDATTLVALLRDAGLTDPGRGLFLWSLLGAIPGLWRQAAAVGALDTPGEGQILRRLFLDPGAPLGVEGALHDPAPRDLRGRFAGLLAYLAEAGPVDHGAIVRALLPQEAGRPQVSAYLQTLIALGLVERTTPFGAAEGSRRARYGLADNFQAAWLGGIGRSLRAAAFRPVLEVESALRERLNSHTARRLPRLLRAFEAARAAALDPGLGAPAPYWERAEGGGIEFDAVLADSGAGHLRLVRAVRFEARLGPPFRAAFAAAATRFLATPEGRAHGRARITRVAAAPVVSAATRAALAAEGFDCLDFNDYATILGDTRPALFR
ncbi:MAG: hypothetical protein EXQ96_01140 [Alphaproteobacteria bacterium]|nr:hypothetical protein [Alphaproteobacteria bacterium]